MQASMAVAENFGEACPASAPFFGYMGAAAALIFASACPAALRAAPSCAPLRSRRCRLRLGGAAAGARKGRGRAAERPRVATLRACSSTWAVELEWRSAWAACHPELPQRGPSALCGICGIGRCRRCGAGDTGQRRRGDGAVLGCHSG